MKVAGTGAAASARPRTWSRILLLALALLDSSSLRFLPSWGDINWTLFLYLHRLFHVSSFSLVEEHVCFLLRLVGWIR